MKIPINKLDNRLRQTIEKDEHILHAFKGDMPAVGDAGQVYVALTNRRVLILTKGIFGMGEKTNSVPYGKITSVDRERIIGFTAVVIKEGTVETKILNMKRETANQIFEEITSMIKSKETQTSNDTIKALKLRYAKGEITKKEFERIKKDLE